VWVIIFLLFSIYDGRRNLRAVDEFTSLFLDHCWLPLPVQGFYISPTAKCQDAVFILCLACNHWNNRWRSISRLVFRLNRNNPASYRRF